MESAKPADEVSTQREDTFPAQTVQDVQQAESGLAPPILTTESAEQPSGTVAAVAPLQNAAPQAAIPRADEQPMVTTSTADSNHTAASTPAELPVPSRARSPPLPAGSGEWRLKEITWPDPRVGGVRRNVKILVQNANGPCSLLALANTLILRGSIHLPAAAWSITYSQLSHLIADFLVTRPETSSATGQPLSLTAALDILPTTVQGLNVNVGFDGIRSFEGLGAGGELALFERAGVDLVHGWLADEHHQEQWNALTRAANAASTAGDELEEAAEKDKETGKRKATYDSVQEAIVHGLEVEMRLLRAKDAEHQEPTGEDKQKAEDAHMLQKFLQDTASQLTYPGLFSLSELPAGSVVAFFRNSHLSVLYRRPPPTVDLEEPSASAPSHEPVLFQLITDSSFASDSEYTWESLVDIDGSEAAFYNSEFVPSCGAGGDWSGVSPERIVREQERKARELAQTERLAKQGDTNGQVDLTAYMSPEERDLQLARALQEEEDRQIAQNQQDREQRRRRREDTRIPASVAGRAAPQTEATSGTSRKQKAGRSDGDAEKDKKCCIM